MSNLAMLGVCGAQLFLKLKEFPEKENFICKQKLAKIKFISFSSLITIPLVLSKIALSLLYLESQFYKKNCDSKYDRDSEFSTFSLRWSLNL